MQTKLVALAILALLASASESVYAVPPLPNVWTPFANVTQFTDYGYDGGNGYPGNPRVNLNRSGWTESAMKPCAVDSWEPLYSLSAQQKDRIAEIVLAATIARKKVRLKLMESAHADCYDYFYAVEVQTP
jgi:ribonuclease HII